MKKVIIFLGASIFENFKRENKNEAFSNLYKPLVSIGESEADKNKDRYLRVKSVLSRWIERKGEDGQIESVATEIRVLNGLSNSLKDDFEVYLLYPQTLLEKLAGEIIMDLIKHRVTQVEMRSFSFNISSKDELISSLRQFDEIINNIAGGNWNDVIIDISGADVMLIPYIMTLVQSKGIKICSVLGETNVVIWDSNKLSEIVS